MDDLIKALTILNKYIDPSNKWPTWCDYEELNVCVSPENVTSEDINELLTLGFFPNIENICFTSYRFGSC
jgi:hypothetical protein